MKGDWRTSFRYYIDEFADNDICKYVIFQDINREFAPDLEPDLPPSYSTLDLDFNESPPDYCQAVKIKRNCSLNDHDHVRKRKLFNYKWKVFKSLDLF